MKPRGYFIGTTLADNPVPHHFVALAGELVARGHRVVILAPHRRVELAQPAGNPAIYIWPSARPTHWQDAVFLRRLLAQYRPDCLVANFVAVNLMAVVGAVCRVPRRVAWYHTLSSQIAIDGALPQWRLALLRRRKALAYRASTHIVPVSQAALADIGQLYPQQQAKCRVFLNALADPLPDGRVADGARPPHLICVARFDRSKGQDVLIHALALLKDRHPVLSVEFVGTGPLQADCERLAQAQGVAGRCTFAGRLEHTEVLRRMARAQATVLPSRSDNCPLVTIESLAVGTPLVGSRVGGIPEIVRDRVDGYLVPPDNPPVLADKLDRLLANAPLAQRLCANARAGFLARFQQRDAVRRQADWLEEIVN